MSKHILVAIRTNKTKQLPISPGSDWNEETANGGCLFIGFIVNKLIMVIACHRVSVRLWYAFHSINIQTRGGGGTVCDLLDGLVG